VPKLRDGDLFAIPLPDNDFLAGRVLLDLDRVFKQGLAGASSPFYPRRGAILVEVYAEPTPEPSARVGTPLIASAWIDGDAIRGREKPAWPIVGRHAVDPERVDFPETVVDVESKATFDKGEIRKMLATPSTAVERWNARSLFLSSARFIYICNYYLGRTQRLGARPEAYSLATSDLRYSPHRAAVYALMKEDPARSYFEWATAEGLDPGRLWR
jgi:hypothetical protein